MTDDLTRRLIARQHAIEIMDMFDRTPLWRIVKLRRLDRMFRDAVERMKPRVEDAGKSL